MSAVIFNLADTSSADITNAKNNLQLRSKHLTIHAYELWELLANDGLTGLLRTGTDERVNFAQIQRQCNSARKIIISTHGPLDATDYGVLKDPINALPDVPAAPAVPNVEGRSVRLTLNQISEMLGRFIQVNRKYYIATLICYAARTGNHRANHGVAGVLDWSDSFACKLFAKLCENRTEKLTMSARTGQHGFSTTTGLSEVQTEAAVEAEIAVAESGDNHDALLAWIEETKLHAFGARVDVVRNEGTVAFAQDYFAIEAVTESNRRAAILRQKIATYRAQLPAEDLQRLERYLTRMQQDQNRTEVACHNGKIYYYFNPNRQRISIKRDNRNTIGWHSKTDLQTSALATVLGTL